MESELASKESALQQSRRAAQVGAADNRLGVAKLQQELAELAVRMDSSLLQHTEI